MLSRDDDDEINQILDRLFEIKELLVHGLYPGAGAKAADADGDRFADENLLAKYLRTLPTRCVIEQLSNSLRRNVELNSEFKHALSRSLKVSLQDGLKRVRDKNDKAPLHTFLRSHPDYLAVLQNFLNNAQLMQALRNENKDFLDYLQTGQFKQFPVAVTDYEQQRQQLSAKHNESRTLAPVLITQQPKKNYPVSDLNKQKLHFFTPQEIKQQQEIFYQKLDEQIVKNEINTAFSTKLTALNYALPVLKLLPKLQDAFFKAGLVTQASVAEIVDVLANALRDSSEVHAVFRIIVAYLKDNDVEKLKRLLVEKSNLVATRFEKCDIVTKQKRQTNEFKFTLMVASDLIILFNFRDVNLRCENGSIINLKKWLETSVYNEIKRIENDSRLYEGTQTNKMVMGALELAIASLRQYGNFINHLLSLRPLFEADKIGFFNKTNSRNEVVLTYLDEKLADALHAVGNLNLQELYLNFSPALQVALEQNNISPNLKNALQELKEHYDNTLNPNQRNRPRRL